MSRELLKQALYLLMVCKFDREKDELLCDSLVLKIEEEIEKPDEFEEITAQRDAIKQQAQQWKMEAMTQGSIVKEIYQAITGGTGEPGDWNGAKPVINRLREAERDAVRYRYLRNTNDCEFNVVDGCGDLYVIDSLDKAIDAAMAKDKDNG